MNEIEQQIAGGPLMARKNGMPGAYWEDENDSLRATGLVSVNGKYCSGVLIYPTVMITAAHCFCGIDRTSPPDPSQKFDVAFPTNSTANCGDDAVTTNPTVVQTPSGSWPGCKYAFSPKDDVKLHPLAEPFCVNQGDLSAYPFDLALIHLPPIPQLLEGSNGNGVARTIDFSFTEPYYALEKQEYKNWSPLYSDPILGLPPYLVPIDLIAGFGRSAWDTVDQGTLYWGRDLPEYDFVRHCDSPYDSVKKCSSRATWNSTRSDGITTKAPGDSGGGQFLVKEPVTVDANGNAVDPQYVLTGIWFGRKTDDEGYSADVHAALGMNDNYPWLVQNIFPWVDFGDEDNDGITDSIDNCPGWRCKQKTGNAGDCWNHGQEDEDGDGVGDVCDNCRPHYDCPSDTPEQCANAIAAGQIEQQDTDADGVGDVCDPCPKVPMSETSGDADGNGIPDSCDICPNGIKEGTAFGGYKDCDDDGDCLNRGEKCIRPSAAYGIGHCLQQIDRDDDKVGDLCDQCPTVFNLGLENSNGLAETANAGAGVRLDACDPVPVLALKGQNPIYYDTDLPPTPGSGGVTDLAKIRTRTVLGEDTESGSFNPPPTQNVNLRHCGCRDPITGFEREFNQCTSGTNPLCSPATTFNSSAWLPITVTRDGSKLARGRNLLRYHSQRLGTLT